jgi:cytochrome c553
MHVFSSRKAPRGELERLCRASSIPAGLNCAEGAAIYSSGFSASRAARCLACHGVRSHPVPVALVGEWSIPVV